MWGESQNNLLKILSDLEESVNDIMVYKCWYVTSCSLFIFIFYVDDLTITVAQLPICLEDS